jgi:hypothetical protein
MEKKNIQEPYPRPGMHYAHVHCTRPFFGSLNAQNGPLCALLYHTNSDPGKDTFEKINLEIPMVTQTF